jgi:hypothetical protein
MSACGRTAADKGCTVFVVDFQFDLGKLFEGEMARKVSQRRRRLITAQLDDIALWAQAYGFFELSAAISRLSTEALKYVKGRRQLEKQSNTADRRR